ncbi:MAG TPA: iron-sulfur cluster assembly protein, partial [Jatrophihabitantaceae bacterium]|nr:iron-sulfur cluster assembly protein [Jatrophihabitantaceae bacterium]
MTTLDEDIRTALETVMDPCAESAGVPLSIVDMGLLSSVDVSGAGDVKVMLKLTTPGCILGVMKFTHEIQDRVLPMPGVRSVDVDFLDVYDWTEAEIAPEGRRKLELSRSQRRSRAKVQSDLAS